MNKMLLVLLLLFTIVLSIVGCGGGDDDTSTDSLTKAQFVEQGNVICVKGEKGIEAKLQQFVKEDLPENRLPSKDQLTEVAEDILIPSVDEEVEEIRALGVPAEGAKEAKAVLAAYDQAIEEGEKDPVTMGSKSVVVFRDANQKAAAFGLTKCLVN
ncbi:MAG TPA: hypothetical protein VKB23_01180 [Solirubrobacterales bacterium]|nr:hypothetical protein [Solirubrobacterales bacterium]